MVKFGEMQYIADGLTILHAVQMTYPSSSEQRFSFLISNLLGDSSETALESESWQALRKLNLIWGCAQWGKKHQW